MNDEELRAEVGCIICDKNLIRPDDIQIRLNQLRLSHSDRRWIRVISQLMEADVFHFLLFLPFIGSKLVDIAEPSQQFYELIDQIVLKVQRDRMIRPFVQALVNIGELNPKSEEIFSGITDPVAAGLVLGGLSHRNKSLSPEIKKLLTNPQEESRICGAVALDTSIGNVPDDEIKPLLSQLTRDQSSRIQSIAFASYVTLYKRRSLPVGELLLIVKQSPNLKPVLLDLLFVWFKQIPSDELLLILEATCDSTQDRVVERASFFISQVDVNAQRALSIIRKWMENEVYHRAGSISAALQSIGQNHPDASILFLEKWMTEGELEWVKVLVPDLAHDLFVNDPTQLLSKLDEWMLRDDRFRAVSHAILRNIVSRMTENNPLVDKCLEIVVADCNRRGLGIEKIIKTQSNKRYRCMDLTEYATAPVLNIDYNLVETNFKKLPNLAGFMNPGWLPRMRTQSNTTHPLILLLWRAEPDMKKVNTKLELARQENDILRKSLILLSVKALLTPSCCLIHLDSMLGAIDSRDPRKLSYKQSLENSEDFWPTYREIECAGLLSSKFKIQLKPKLGGNELDIKLLLNGESVLVEVRSTQTSSKLEHSVDPIFLANRVPGILTTEADQIAALPPDDKTPCLVILECSGSDIDEHDTANAVLGSLAVRFAVQEPNIPSWTIRQPDEIHHREPQTDCISAVLMYKCDFDSDDQPHYTVSWISSSLQCFFSEDWS